MTAVVNQTHTHTRHKYLHNYPSPRQHHGNERKSNLKAPNSVCLCVCDCVTERGKKERECV